MDTVRVRFEPAGSEADVPPGTTLHAAAAAAGVHLEAPCGGLGRCGSCRVRAEGGMRPAGSTERQSLSPADLAAGYRLACLARVDGPDPVTVRVPAPRGPIRIQTAAPPSARPSLLGTDGWGAAVDLGTTTIAVTAFDLATGAVLGTAAGMNPQVRYGHDVLTRISRAMAGDAGGLRRAAAEEIERLVRASAGETLSDPRRVVAVGNPTMIHLLLGRDVRPLAGSPYEGALVDRLALSTRDAGLPKLGDAQVVIGPAVSAFVGADVVAGVVATRIAGSDYPAILLDLGTNGEMVLASRSGLLATSAAGGPALEGVSIRHGMRAESGAIESARLTADGLELGVIGGGEPRGICGSGLLDLAAVLLRSGAVDAGGRLVAAGTLAARVATTDAGEEFRVADGVVLTQQDIRQLQLAKGAVATAIAIVLDKAGLPAEDVREVVVAGGFGNHIDPASLAAIGMIPAVWADRVTFAGNAALAGASAMLLDPALLDAATALALTVRTVDLATEPTFQARFIASLDFPCQSFGAAAGLGSDG